MDVVSEVLSWLRVEGTVSRRSEFSAPWGIAYSMTNIASFFVVERGRCVLRIDGREPVEVHAGDLVMLTPGRVVSLADEVSTPTVPYTQVLEEATVLDEERYSPTREEFPPIEYGGGGKSTVIRGWGLRFERYEHHPLLSLVPPFIHVTYQRRTSLPWLETTLRFLNHETHQRRDGSDMMVVRLVDLLFVQVVRAWFQEQPDEDAGWVGALRDGAIRHALTLVHRYPADAWTVERLGKAVGMSRSSFSARFQSLVSVSPLRYLTQVRMHLAANALQRDTRASLVEVAVQVGYDTESSFGRAFKRHFGVSPGAFRRTLREDTRRTGD